MDATNRRAKILEMINNDPAPVSASTLAKALGVSRQVIVGDIALLRARGREIIATARGYIIPEFRDAGCYIGKIACCHTAAETAAELYVIVDLGATVVNVIVEHEIYGEITGQLNLKTRDDADAFINRVAASEVRLLSALTLGVHLHTVSCRNKVHFEQVCHALGEAGFLLQE